MCDAKKCRHERRDLCSCRPVQKGNVIELAAHMAANMKDVEWELDYKSLETVMYGRLCLVGKCKVCGGRLCIEQKPFDARTTDDFLLAAYHRLDQFHHNVAPALPDEEFRKRFVEMFRADDASVIREWLSRPENQSVQAMHRRSGKTIYTVVHTWANADKADFAAPEGLFSCTDPARAQRELKRLAEQEKEEMQFPFEEQLYREEYDDTFWEAYCDGYAAGWFTRYEIIESPLYMGSEEMQEV